MLREEPKAKLIFKKKYPYSIVPIKGSAKAAGYDLFYCPEDKKENEQIIIPAKGKQKLPTGIFVELPQNTYGRIAPRSGLTWKKFLDVGAGVIDEDYRGEICVILFNFSDENVIIKKGEKIAQLIVEKIMPTEVEVYECDKNLSETERGENGFGSTDNKKS